MRALLCVLVLATDARAQAEGVADAGVARTDAGAPAVRGDIKVLRG